MKKLLWILLAAAMLCVAFTACGSGAGPDNSAAPSDNAATSAAYRFGFVMTGPDESSQALSEAVVAGFEEIGWEADYVNGEFDAAVQSERIINYASAGTDVILVQPVNSVAISAAVDVAREAGSKVIVMEEPTENWDGFLSSDNVATGRANAWMCAQFVEAHWPDAAPGTIPVALLTNNSSYDAAAQSQGLRSVTEYTDKVYIAAERELRENSAETGMQAAESIYATNPEVTLFLTMSDQSALGVNSYFSGADSPVDDLSDYGIWGTNSAEEALNAIQETAKGNGMFRGINIQSGIPETVRIAVDIATGLMDGRYDHVEIPANVYLVNTENVGDWMANEYVNLRWDFENSCGMTED